MLGELALCPSLMSQSFSLWTLLMSQIWTKHYHFFHLHWVLQCTEFLSLFRICALYIFLEIFDILVFRLDPNVCPSIISHLMLFPEPADGSSIHAKDGPKLVHNLNWWIDGHLRWMSGILWPHSAGERIQRCSIFKRVSSEYLH